MNKITLILLALLLLSGCQSTDFNNAQQANTVEAYDTFLNQYPDNGKASEYQQKAKALREQLLATAAYKIALAENTVDGYKTFLEKYPDAKEQYEGVERWFDARLAALKLDAHRAPPVGDLSAYQLLLDDSEHLGPTFQRKVRALTQTKRRNIINANTGWLTVNGRKCTLYNPNPNKVAVETIDWSGDCNKDHKITGFGEIVWYKGGQKSSKNIGMANNGRLQGVTKIYDYKIGQWQFRQMHYSAGWREDDNYRYVQITDRECMVNLPETAKVGSVQIETDIPCQAGLLHGQGDIVVRSKYNDKWDFERRIKGLFRFGEMQGPMTVTGYSNSCGYSVCIRHEDRYGYIYQYDNSVRGKKLGGYGTRCSFRTRFEGCIQYENLSTGKVSYPNTSVLARLYEGLKTVGQVAGKLHQATQPVFNTAICGNPDYCEVSETHQQGKNITSNVAASQDSTGSLSSVCFYLNNTLELDTNNRLEIKHTQRGHLKTTNVGLFGSNCINGDDLGGTYRFEYSTNNRRRSGEFSISGDHPQVYLELSANFIKDGPFEIFIREQ